MRRFTNIFLAIAIVGILLGISLSPAYAQEGISLSKVASSDNASIGDNITYTYTIINNSSDNLTGLKLLDDKLGDIAIPEQMLSGENVSVTASHIVSIDDYSENNTEIINIATLIINENIIATDNETVSLNPYNSVLEVSKEADITTAMLDDVITYTYTVTNNGNVEINNVLLNDDKLGNIPLISDNLTISSLLPGENVTATATYKVVFSDLMAGLVTNTATATGLDPSGQPVIASSIAVTVTTDIVKVLLTKAQILTLSGVPGKGISTAPGLQKPFNPNSQASEHAGKKVGKGNLEQNQEQNQNHETNLEPEQEQNQELNGASDNQQSQNNGKGLGKSKKNK
jgi:uncharacterized repeat protein (TIGR01451 family)